MNFNPPTSPPPQHFDTYTPVSPHASMGSDGRRSTHSTPKRRRLASSDHLNFDQAPPFAVPDDAFASWSPVEEYHEYRHRQPHQPPPPFDPYWDMFGSSWSDMSEAFHPSFMPTQPPAERQPQHLPERMSTSPQASVSRHPRFAPQPYHQDLYFRNEPIRPNMIPEALPTHPSHQAIPSHVSFQPSIQTVFRKGAIILTLCRATQKSIEEIAEHKRECPACQLDFEPDNVLAIIDCCNTAMHAVCFSAWINSRNGPGGSRTKSCMKCRKAIDATHKLNAVLPPVDGKSWDEGSDFNAPAQLTVNKPIKFDVSTPPDPSIRRHRRREPHAYRPRPVHVTESEVFEESREEFRSLVRTQVTERERLAARVIAANQAWSSAFEVEAHAARIASDAKDTLDAGGPITQREVDGLVRRAREAKEVHEESREEWRAMEAQLKRLDTRQREAQLEFVQRMRQRRATRTETNAGPVAAQEVNID